jgi:prepilin-type N-terminal cleavage/methylation domain-containing protein
MAPVHRTSERGFTVVEVMVAVLLLTVGLVGTMQAFISSDGANLTTQRAQALSTAAEQELEQLRAMSYSSLALSSIPTATTDGNQPGDNSGDPSDPDYWISGANLLIPNDFAQETSGTLPTVASTGEVLIGGGTVPPGPVTLTSDGFTVTVYRFISWVNDTCVYGSQGDLCPGTEDAKRLTVAVVLDGGGVGESKPFWLTTIVANPAA